MTQVKQDNVQIKLEIDGSQSRTELDNLTRKAQLLQDGFKGLKKGSEEYVAQNKELSQVNARMKELREEIGLTALTSGQLKAMASQLNRELSNLTPETASFVNKAEELARVTNRLDELRAQALAVKDGLNGAGGGFTDFLKKAAGFAGIQLGVQAVVSGLQDLGRESIKAAVEGSDSIADMEKSLNATTAEAKALRGQLENIDTRTSEKNLEAIAVAGGQLGRTKEEIVAFTTSVDQAVVALGDEFTGGVEDVTKSLGGLQKLFKETADVSPAEAITKIGSAVNALGADGQATGPVIADFAARIGQLGNLAPQITQTLGLGAAFQELGLTAEISAGGLSNILLTASKDAAGFGKQIGLTSKEFQDLINTDPNEVIVRLAASLKGASNTEVVNTLDKLGIKSQEATKVISLLAEKSDFVRQKQALASAEYAKGTSLLDEFAKKNTNAAAEVAKAEKGFTQFRLELGGQLLPVYLRVLQLTGLVIDVLKALPGFMSDNKTAFGLLALALAAFNAEQIAAQASTIRSLALQKLVALGVLTETEGKYALITATELQTGAQAGLNAAMEANPIGVVLTLLALFLFGLKQLYDNSETFRGAVDGLFDSLRPLGGVFRNIVDAIAPLANKVANFFSTVGGGKAVLELFGYLMGVSIIVPLKLVVAQIELSVAALTGFLDVGKRVANFFGAGFKIDPNGSFSAFGKSLKDSASSIGKTLSGTEGKPTAAGAAAPVAPAGSDGKAAAAKQADADAAAAAQKKKAAAASAEADAKSSLEGLKAREANIKAALALVQAGSAEELRLKKQEIFVKRDIDLAGEKKTEGDKKVIRAEALRDVKQLEDAAAEKSKSAAEKRAKEQADVEKKLADLRSAALTDETEKKVQQLTAAADKEKATAKGTAEQIAEQRRLLEEKLARDVAEVRRQVATKQAEEELGLERQRNALIVNEFDRRAADLRTAAAGEALKIQATDALGAQKRVLIQAKLQQDLLKLEADRVANQAEINARIVAIDDDIALRRLARRRQQASVFGQVQAQADAEEQAIRKAQLDEQYARDLFKEGLSNEEKLAISRQYLDQKQALEEEYADRGRERSKAQAEEALGYASTVLSTIGDFQKIASDKELAKADKDKKARLLKLDQEYKAGAVSKDAYEAQKASIEANYDAKTRQIKKEAAEKEKALNIAQAIIAGALSVIKASPNVPLMIASGVVAAAGVAKIIATPIPEFAKGGVVGAPRPTWRERVRRFATGGRINATAGVAGVGQRHSGGGIRMVDGATGEHLGEWERGEPYMILSRDTYANNRHLVDELIDTSLYRSGAPVRPKPGYYADGGVVGDASGVAGAGNAAGQELVQAVRETRDAVRALPSRQRIAWTGEDTAYVEDELNDRSNVRASNAIR